MEDVKKLVALVEKSDVTHIAWQRGSEKVVIRRGGNAAAPVVHPVPAIHAAPVAAPVASPAPAAPAAPKADAKTDKPGTIVTSPFVGTFYRAPVARLAAVRRGRARR